MGGSIAVESELGEGSTFTVVLPFMVDRSSAQTKKPRAFSTLRALIVDDDESECEYAASILKRLKIKSDGVHDGKAALRKVKAREESGYPYDFCLMDWKMPQEDGIVASKNIREHCKSDLPIIMLTAYDTEAIKDEALKAGVNLVVSKPLFESTLFNLLLSLYGNYEKGDDKPLQQNFVFKGIRVLLAEDNDMNLEIATDLLSHEGILITPARDGKRAVKLFESNKERTFDAILMDIQMPGLDGYEATKAIRALDRPDAKLIPVIAMTADAFTSDVSLALASGMNDHVSKPIDRARLFKVLAEQIEKARKERGAK